MLTRSLALCLAAFATATACAEAAQPPDFGPAVEISPPLPHPYYMDPDVAVRDGRMVAVWNKVRIGEQSWIQAAELDAGGNPGPPTTIEASPNSGWDNDPSVGLSGAERTVVAWQRSPDVGPVSGQLSVLDQDLVPGPPQVLGAGNDPVVRYPATGDGLVAWGGTGALSVAPIDPLGTLGAERTIPLGGEASYALNPTIELAPGGGRVYWTSRDGVTEASVNQSGEAQSVETLLPPPPASYGYRDVTVSGPLLVALLQQRRHVNLICVPLEGGAPVTIDSSAIRIGSLDVDASGRHGLISWTHRRRGSGSWVAKAATVDDGCRASRSVSLPSAGRRAYDTQVGHDARSPLALVAGGGGLESVTLSRSGEVRGSRRVANTRPFSRKLESRTPVTGLKLVTEPGSRPIAVWAQSHRGPGQTIAASVAR